MLNKLVFSYFNTSFGYWLAGFLIPLIVLDVSKSPLLVSVSYALNIIPYIIFTPFAGVIGDMVNRKKVIILGELICAITATVLLLVPFNNEFVWEMILLGFVISSMSAIHHPIFQAIIPDIYKGDDLKKINSNINIIDSLVSILSPVILGVILLSMDKHYVIVLIIFCYVLSFSSFSFIPYASHHNNVAFRFSNIMSSMSDGVKYVFNVKGLRNISILFFFVNFGIRVIAVNLFWIYSMVFHLKDDELALCFVIIGLGSFLGAKAAIYLIGKFNDENIIAGSTFFIGVFSLLLLVANNAIVMSLILSLSSFVQSIIVVTFFTYRQKITEGFILSRVISVTRLISFMAIPLSSLISGYILQKTENVNIIYSLSGIVVILSLFLFFILRKKTS
ncbi:putative Arabinose efflux permease family protein [Xenorhabdus bovienii str. puntauvense]|uniref:Putative Arabinose efflux permease family protein n=1 Tax=Xenorhabdus bovienii str. puntauvense TaxID=1398201 RepID=A0A077NHS0_XENBV|nr:MFS transporter [Xenorhabdus bovienii]MCG3462872.1 MFS transporter [Xenorhabdus bovienii]CDG98239.1 putative Arabinose efflux permease family protein [Xenorhabdus bovienii str. puntauvense]